MAVITRKTEVKVTVNELKEILGEKFNNGQEIDNLVFTLNQGYLTFDFVEDAATQTPQPAQETPRPAPENTGGCSAGGCGGSGAPWSVPAEKPEPEPEPTGWNTNPVQEPLQDDLPVVDDAEDDDLPVIDNTEDDRLERLGEIDNDLPVIDDGEYEEVNTPGDVIALPVIDE